MVSGKTVCSYMWLCSHFCVFHCFFLLLLIIDVTISSFKKSIQSNARFVFFDYKSLFAGEINIEEAEIKKEEDYDGNKNVQYRMDIIWYQLQELSSPARDNLRFRLLFRVAAIALITPHSNA